MKHLETDFAGGFPLVLDDIRWMQNALKEAVSHVMKPFLDSNEAVILKGIDFSLGGGGFGTAQTSEGFVFFNGEVFYAPHSVFNYTPGTSVICVKVDEVVDADGDKTMADGTGPNSSYIDRQAEVYTTSNPSGHVKLPMKKVHDIIFDRIQEKGIDETILKALSILPGSPTGLPAGSHILYGRKLFTGQFCLSGTVVVNSENVNILTIPEPFRPEYNQHLLLPMIGGLSYVPTYCTIVIKTDGDVDLIKRHNSSETYFILSLDGVCYF